MQENDGSDGSLSTTNQRVTRVEVPYVRQPNGNWNNPIVDRYLVAFNMIIKDQRKAINIQVAIGKHQRAKKRAYKKKLRWNLKKHRREIAELDAHIMELYEEMF